MDKKIIGFSEENKVTELSECLNEVSNEEVMSNNQGNSINTLNLREKSNNVYHL